MYSPTLFPVHDMLSMVVINSKKTTTGTVAGTGVVDNDIFIFNFQSYESLSTVTVQRFQNGGKVFLGLNLDVKKISPFVVSNLYRPFSVVIISSNNLTLFESILIVAFFIVKQHL